MTGSQIVLLVTVAASLILAVRAFRSWEFDRSKTVVMAGIWLIIIVALAFVLQHLAP